MSAESQVLAWAAREAQRILAPMADPDGGGVFTITLAGTDYDFTATLEEDPNMLLPTPNGLEKVYGLRLAAERSQFTAAEETLLAAGPAARAFISAKGKGWRLLSATPQAQFFQLVAVVA